jgi:hypothetical protein
MPSTRSEQHIADFREPKAAPLAAQREAGIASAAELKGQRPFLSLRVTEDDRAELARLTLVDAVDLQALAHRADEKLVILARRHVRALSHHGTGTASDRNRQVEMLDLDHFLVYY